MAKKTISEKEKSLLEVIEKAKKDLVRLQEKQKIEIGNLAYKFKLNELDGSILENEFKEIAKKHNLS